METWSQTRSVPMAVVVTLAIIIGVVLLYAMPVIKGPEGDDVFDEERVSLSYGDIQEYMGLAGGGWAKNLSLAGWIIAVAAAVAIPKSMIGIQRLVVTAASIASMAVPFWISRNLDGGSLGMGAILAWILFAVAAIVPWLIRADTSSTQSPSWMSS